MYAGKMLDDCLCNPTITMRPCELLGTVCVQGGVDCPLIAAPRAREVLDHVGRDPTVAIALVSPADRIPHYTAVKAEDWGHADPDEVFNRKRDLDILHFLGLVPSSVRRSRYLYTLLFERIESPDGICAYDTPGWEGCPHARSGAYEGVRAKGWKAVVHDRSEAEREEFRTRSARQIAEAERLFVRPHHFMCMSCWLGGSGGTEPRPNDTIYEIFQRIRREPDVPVTLVEGCCMACDCCDGFHPDNGRCVHACGLIRDYKKDLDVFQKLGLMPGATLPARDVLRLIYERVLSTRDVCGYGDGVVRSHEWSICGGPDGNPGYVKARESGALGLVPPPTSSTPGVE